LFMTRQAKASERQGEESQRKETGSAPNIMGGSLYLGLSLSSIRSVSPPALFFDLVVAAALVQSITMTSLSSAPARGGDDEKDSRGAGRGGGSGQRKLVHNREWKRAEAAGFGAVAARARGRAMQSNAGA
jgi:hypothetical protein